MGTVKLTRLLGGRPMRREGFAFVDVVANRPVFYWRDTLNRRWLAFGAWSLFRVPAGYVDLKETDNA